MSDEQEGAAKGGPDSDGSEGVLDGALISPDDPIPERSDFPEDALISPDAPIERVAKMASRASTQARAFLRRTRISRKRTSASSGGFPRARMTSGQWRSP